MRLRRDLSLLPTRRAPHESVNERSPPSEPARRRTMGETVCHGEPCFLFVFYKLRALPVPVMTLMSDDDERK